MSRRVYSRWRLSTACSAKSSSWGGVAGAFIRGTEWPSLRRAQRGCMFSALEETSANANSKRREEDPVDDNCKDAIINFIESYSASYRKYPSIRLVARETGGSKREVKQLLNYVKSGRNTTDSDKASLEGSGNPHSLDIMCSTSDNTPNKIWNKDSNGRNEFKSLASIIGSDTAEPLVDDTGREDMSTFAEIIRGSDNSDAFDLEFSEWLGQSSSKEKPINKLAPLIEVLQHSGSGSRRVHLSAWSGGEKDLSWDKTLLSIMPLSIEKNQQDLSEDSLTCTLSASAEAGEHSTLTCSSAAEIGEVSTIADIGQDSHSTYVSQYGVKLMSTRRATVLHQFTSEKLVEYLKSISEVFLDLQKNVLRITRKGVPVQAILYFKTEKGMMAALSLKTLVIKGETLHLESVTKAGEDKEDDDIVFKQDKIICSPNFLCHGITLEDCPVHISLKSIHEFFSVFGELSILQGENFPRSKGVVFLTFKNENDKKKALRVHQFEVDGCKFHMRMKFSPSQLVIRLVSEQDEADKRKAMDACQKYGIITKFMDCIPGILDAYYTDNERRSVKKILDSLRQDKDLKGIWEPTVVYEGYSRYCQEKLRDTFPGDIKKLVYLTEQLSKHVEKMNAERDGLQKEIPADDC